MSLKNQLSNGTDRIDDLADDALDAADADVQDEAAETIQDGASSALDGSRSALATAFAYTVSGIKTAASAAWSATTTAFTHVRNGLGAALAFAAMFAKNNERKLVALSVAATVFVVLAYVVSKRDVSADVPALDD